MGPGVGLVVEHGVFASASGRRMTLLLWNGIHGLVPGPLSTEDVRIIRTSAWVIIIFRLGALLACTRICPTVRMDTATIPSLKSNIAHCGPSLRGHVPCIFPFRYRGQ